MYICTSEGLVSSAMGAAVHSRPKQRLSIPETGKVIQIEVQKLEGLNLDAHSEPPRVCRTDAEGRTCHPGCAVTATLASWKEHECFYSYSAGREVQPSSVCKR